VAGSLRWSHVVARVRFRCSASSQVVQRRHGGCESCRARNGRTRSDGAKSGDRRERSGRLNANAPDRRRDVVAGLVSLRTAMERELSTRNA